MDTWQDLAEATMRSGADIRASVLVIAYSPPELLERCLEALRKQRGDRDDIEFLVIAQPDHQGSSFQETKVRFPEFKWVDATSSHNVARMRGLGIARSVAPVIAMLEGDCVPAPGWLEAVSRMQPEAAIGGAIEPGNFTHSADWAAYFAEFGRYMLPLPGKTSQLPGANVVYRRSRLPDSHSLESGGFYETFINSALSDSHPTDAALLVRHERAWTGRRLLETRFNHGRGFASLRTAQAGVLRRLTFMGLSLILPLVLIARVVGEPLRRRRLFIRTAFTLPWTVALAVSWAAGEFVGYAAGPGSSLDNWR